MLSVFIDVVESPLGTVVFAVAAERLCALGFGADHTALDRALQRRFPGVQRVAAPDPCGIGERLRAYFAGDLHAIDAIPIDPGGTPFQAAVWNAVRAVPPGTTLSYGALAALVGRPAASRAVGAANGANPIAVVVPCHRLIGADGKLVRYGGGLERKRWLLQHEGVQIADNNA